MVRMTDVIEEFLKDLIKEEDGSIEIQRNELASHFNCVPSQINYVISTRFSNKHGYLVESRRGGGGSIKIRKVNIRKPDFIMHIMKSIGKTQSQQMAYSYITNLYENRVITRSELRLLMAATSDQVLKINQPYRDIIRANILKNMLLTIKEKRKEEENEWYV